MARKAYGHVNPEKARRERKRKLDKEFAKKKRRDGAGKKHNEDFD